MIADRHPGAAAEARAGDAVRYHFQCSQLSDSYVVRRFECVEALNRPYSATLVLDAQDEGTDATELLGKDVILTIERSDAHQRLFHGVVDRVRVLDHDATTARLAQTAEVSVVPALSSLARRINTRISQDRTSLDIVIALLAEALGPYHREVDASGVDASRLVARDYCVQYRETDLDFVHRLLEEDGIGYRFDQAGPEKLVLFDDNRSMPVAPSLPLGPVRFDPVIRHQDDAEPVSTFISSVQRTSTRLTARDYDWTRGRAPLLEAGAEVAEGAHEHEVYEHGLGRNLVIHEDNQLLSTMLSVLQAALVAAGTEAGGFHDRVLPLPGAVFESFSSSNLEDRVRIRQETLRRDARSFSGTSAAIGFSPGSHFTLLGHPTLGADGDYYLTKVHHGSALSGDGADASAGGYHNRFECLPIDTPWRPDRTTHKPRIHGIQTARVTGPIGLDVYTDSHGRIKVRFPWDRATETPAGDYTCWLRVSQVWAGSGAPGFMFIPRVGMEVVVSFIDGDPDRPLVTGCVYNGENPTPSMLPVQATKSIIRTRTVPHGPGYNELSFEDAMGMERVHLRAERDLEELVLNDHLTNVHRSQANRVVVDQVEEVGRDAQLYVHGDRTVNVTGLYAEHCASDHIHTVHGREHVSVGHDYHLEVEGGPFVIDVGHGESVLRSRGPILFEQGDDQLIELTSDDEGKGILIRSTESTVHLTEDKIELKIGDSIIHMDAQHVRVNGRIFPAQGHSLGEEEES